MMFLKFLSSLARLRSVVELANGMSFMALFIAFMIDPYATCWFIEGSRLWLVFVGQVVLYVVVATLESCLVSRIYKDPAKYFPVK